MHTLYQKVGIKSLYCSLILSTSLEAPGGGKGSLSSKLFSPELEFPLIVA